MIESKQILEAANSYLNCESLSPNEIECVKTILAKRNVTFEASENVDKDRVFQVATALLEGTVLVVSQSADSDHKQIEKLLPTKIHPAYFNSLLKENGFRAKVLTRIKDAEFDIIYVAREEIDKRDFIDAVKELDIALIATYGPAFPTSISDLLKHLNSQPKTAVFAGNVFPESNIELRSRKIDFKKNSLETIKGFVIGNHSNETGIVYCLSNKKVDQVRSLLKKARIPAERYGGENSSKNEKEQALKSFNNDAQQCILVSNLTLPTKKITRKDVRFAVHIDPPRSLEEYRDQISFLGLDGLPATSIIIWDDYDFQKYHDMLEKSKISKGTRLEKSTLLMNMRDYCNTPDCLRCYLLDYFSKDHSKNVEPCGICTNCKNNRNRRNW